MAKKLKKVMYHPVDPDAPEGHDAEVTQMLQEIRDQYHPQLRDARIRVVWMLHKKTSAEHGEATPGKTKLLEDAHARLFDCDVVLSLNREEWANVTDAARRFEIDTRLCACGPVMDEETGEQKADEAGWLQWETVKPDVNAQYLGPIERWGMADEGAESLHATLQRALPFGDDESVAEVVQLRRAAA